MVKHFVATCNKCGSFSKKKRNVPTSFAAFQTPVVANPSICCNKFLTFSPFSLDKPYDVLLPCIGMVTGEDGRRCIPYWAGMQSLCMTCVGYA